MQHIVGTSDGDGNVLDIERNADGIDETISPDLLDDNESEDFVQEDPFDGLPTVVEEESVPESLAHVFNKITECIVAGVTWKYRELTDLDKMALGDTPLMQEALISFDEKDATLDTQKFVDSLVSKDQSEIKELNRQISIYRDNILLTSLISMRSGDDEIEITKEVIAALNDGVKNELRDIISPPVPDPEEEAELNSAKRFRKKPRKKSKTW